MDPSGLDVVRGAEVVLAQHEGLQDIDTSGKEPSQGDDDCHDEDVAEVGIDLGRQGMTGSTTRTQVSMKIARLGRPR